MAELNPYVSVKAHSASLSEEFLSKFQVVVMTNAKSTQELQKVSAFCHSKGIIFIAAETRGVFGFIFTDFGNEFVVVDTNGEEPERHIVTSVTQVNCLPFSVRWLVEVDIYCRYVMIYFYRIIQRW